MKKVLVFLLMFPAVIVCNDLNAQSVNNTVNDGIYEKVHVPARKPIPLPYLREADMMWTKKVWRVIDLREKINHPLYFPTTPIGTRKSLAQVLIDGVRNEGINAYKTDDFTRPELMSWEDVKLTFDAVDRERTGKTLDGRDTVMLEKGEIRSSEIKEIILKEEWYFNKQTSTMGVRIIGMCPIRYYVKPSADGIPQVSKNMTFWIHFPEVRQQLVTHEVFNQSNDAKRLTFDDIFFKRFFGSYIVQESNVYNNRRINDYTVGGVKAQMEAERIKMDLFELEHDVWEY